MTATIPTGGQANLERAVQIEAARIAAGIRRPFHWVARTTKAGFEHEGQLCRGCEERITRGERITIEDDINCALHRVRFRFWHADCHPARVERAWNRVRRDLLQRYSELSA